jgi:hypothetical protein
MVRTLLTLLGALGALAWSVLFLQAPGAALELLLFTSPIVVAAWLILMLTAPRRDRPAPAPRSAETGPPPALEERVLRRDAGRCRLCGGEPATRVVARRPPRPGADPVDRFIAICEGCARTAPLRPIAR